MTTRVVVLFSALLFSSCVAFGQTSEPAAVKPAATTTESPDLREFQKIEDTWSNALNVRDQYSLELVLSPLFVDVAASGDITTRNQQLAQVISGDDKTLHMEQHVIAVRMLGDIAVVNGTYQLRHRVSSADMDEKGVFTHVYERLRGGWMCINSQRTLLREDPNAKPRKQSGVATPFHIPFFSKADKKDQ